MNRITVAYLINSLAPGGAERFLVDLIKHLPKQRVEPVVLCLYREGEFAKELESVGVPIQVIGVPRKFGFGGYRLVFRAIRQARPDILHCHLLEGCWYGLPSGWLARVPIRIAHLQNCHWYLPLKLRLFDRFVFQFGHAALGCSKAVLKFYKEKMRYPEQKLYLVYNGIDVNRFKDLPSKNEARQLLGLQQDEIVVATVASLTPQKGHEFLIRAIPKIVAAFPRVRFLFVGDGVLRSDLEFLANNLGVREHIQFMGKRFDVPKILAASDIFVLPSLWEGFGIALVEAGLSGIPAVASRIDGIVEVIEDGKSGILVPPKDTEALAEAILTLIQRPDLRHQMGRVAREVCLARFDISAIARYVLSIYEELLSGIKV